MNKKYSIDSYFLIKILKDEANETEKEFFNNWLEESDEHKEEFGRVALLWEKIGNLPTPLSPDLIEEWNKLENKILKEFQAVNSSQELTDRTSFIKFNKSSSTIFEKYKSRKFVFFSRAAAIIILSLIAYYFINQQVEVNTITETADFKQYEFKTKKGERATIPLSDGSFVYLNADSKLIYPQFFSDDKRLVKLEGEGYFIIKSNPHQPFIVQTDDKFTEVKGTEFNLKYRYNRLSLVVTRGKVVLYNEDSSKFVRVEKDEMIIAQRDKFSQPVKVDTKLYTAWRENKISFVETPLFEIVDELERIYNVDITIKSKKLTSKTLTGYFDSNSLDEILEKISIALDFNFQRNGKKIVIF